MARLEGIYIYPIKSLDGVSVETATIAAGGSLAGDRRYAIVDDDGEYINGKRTPAVHGITAEFDPGLSTVSLDDGHDTTRFELDGNRQGVAAWLDERLDPPVSLSRDDDLGYPDDVSASGPTVVSTGTLETIAGWFDEIDGPTEMRRRLRPNLVIEAEPFWEDRLYAGPDEAVRFAVGDITFEGIKPCQRCVVPTRDPDTGERTEDFRTRFVERRRETLPSWADKRRFDHYYRVTTNTRTSSVSRGDIVAVGEEVVLLDTVPADR